MEYRELIDSLKYIGKDPSRLIFEDELTGIHNRRFLLGYLDNKIRWDTAEDFPVSLLGLDIDHFKQINDTYGHDAGDQTLVWLASLLKEVSGDRAMPVRYSGDEFMVLLPGTDEKAARDVAQRILHQTKLKAFRIKDGRGDVSITVSIGIATAPDSAGNGRELIRSADSALYYAKRAGRNQAASAGEIDLDAVFANRALQKITSPGLVGRDQALGTVSKALDTFPTGTSQLLLFEGAPGMGKTTLLETIRSSLARNEDIRLVNVSGIQQEAYRPYYQATSILLTLLGQREDKATELLQSISPRQMHYLSHILPQLAGDGVETAAEAAEEGEVSRRQEIFRTVTELLAQINDRPLVLLVDDLHFADEATLLLLSVRMKRQDLSVLIISTTIDTLKLDGEEKSSPLERFYASYHETLGIVRMTLSPLRAADIDLHLDGIFPGLKASADLGKELARITQGNPLFVSEVVRKLVTDQKISPKDQGWTIEELEDNYLPRSLEEIVLQQISALDEESRQLLAHASTFGEDVSLSFLTGSSEQEEARVLEFLDRAEALGLVRLDFQINDETMSFLSKRVVEIAYGTLNQNRREELHERVGNYQEKLFEQRLLTSASLLAYHFKRSADRVKAQRYEKVQFAHDRAVFDAREAQWYADNDYFEYAEALKPESLPLVPDVLRTLLAATRSIRLYPEESQPLRSARQHAQSAIDALLAANEALSLSRAEAGLRANGVELDATEFQTLADSFTALLDGADLQSVTFRRGVSEQEMICLLEIISETRTESLGRGYWKQFAAEHGFEHIALRQVRYSRIKSKSTATIQTPEASVEDEFTPGELAQIPDLLRVFLRAAKNIKLYPAGSQPLITGVQHFHQSLKSALSRLPVLTLAAVNESLLVNGAKLSSLELVVIVESFVAYIDSVGLKSLSFFADITPVEVEIFLGALRERPADVDERYWEEVARTHALPGLAFNTQRYALDSLRGASKIEPTPTLPALGDEIVLNATGVGEMGAHGEMQAHREIEADTGEEPFESPLNGFVTVGRDLLLKGDRSGFDR